MKVVNNNVVPITENSDVIEGLRGIIKQINSGEIKPKNCTLVINSYVYHLGDVGDQESIRNAVFNLNVGLQRILEIALDDVDNSN